MSASPVVCDETEDLDPSALDSLIGPEAASGLMVTATDERYERAFCACGEYATQSGIFCANCYDDFDPLP